MVGNGMITTLQERILWRVMAWVSLIAGCLLFMTLMGFLIGWKPTGYIIGFGVAIILIRGGFLLLED
jgi:hypothetical protein